MPGGIIVFAGHRRSPGSLVLLASLLRQAPTLRVEAVLGVSEFRLRRLREWAKRYGRNLPAKILAGLGLSSRTPFDEEAAVLRARLHEWQIGETTVSALCRRHQIPWHVVPDLHAEKCLALIRQYQPACAIYSGGGIIRKPLLDLLAGKILNMHSGPLPHIRGMNGVEWSLFHGLSPTITIHLIDKGIDTGAQLTSQTVAVADRERLGALRGKVLLAGIDLLTNYLCVNGLADWQRQPRAASEGPQYYTMCDSLKALVQSWLDRKMTPVLDTAAVTPGDLAPAPRRQRPVASA